MSLIKMLPHKILATVFSAAAFLLAGCSPLKTLNSLVPDSGFNVTKDIAYGDDAREKLDVYVPVADSKTATTNTVAAKRPLIVFFYGGNWQSGDRGGYKFVAEALTAQGFVVVIPDYRLYPQVKFPELMVDPASAVQWAKQHAAEYGADPQRVFVGGHSAGAHLAAMLTLNEEYLAKVGLKPADLSGMFGLAGPYDFLPLTSDTLKIIFGPEDQRWKSQPINFVTGKNPPMLLLVGLKDNTVWPRNSFHLADKIKAKGGAVQVGEFADYGHIDMVAKLAKPFRDDNLVNAIADFIRTH